MDYFLTAVDTGHCYAQIHVPAPSSPDLTQRQLKVLEDGTALLSARELVKGKIRNQMNLLKFYLRHREETNAEYVQKMEDLESKFKGILDKVEALEVKVPYEEQRNYLFAQEGQAGAAYWDVVRLLVPKEVAFEGRVHQGAQDVVNMALNYGYGILYPRVQRALMLTGLNVRIGLLHASQENRPSLSFDLIEPFRAPVVDRAVLSLLTRRRDLSVTGNGMLGTESARLVAEAVIGRLGTPVPYRGERSSLERVIIQQARLLARSLKDGTRFKAFIDRY